MVWFPSFININAERRELRSIGAAQIMYIFLHWYWMDSYFDRISPQCANWRINVLVTEICTLTNSLYWRLQDGGKIFRIECYVCVWLIELICHTLKMFDKNDDAWKNNNEYHWINWINSIQFKARLQTTTIASTV